VQETVAHHFHVCGGKVTPLEYAVLQPPRAYYPANRGISSLTGKGAKTLTARHPLGSGLAGFSSRTSARRSSGGRFCLWQRNGDSGVADMDALQEIYL